MKKKSNYLLLVGLITVIFLMFQNFDFSNQITQEIECKANSECDPYTLVQKGKIVVSEPVSDQFKSRNFIKNETDGIGIDSLGNIFFAGAFTGQRFFENHKIQTNNQQAAYYGKRNQEGHIEWIFSIDSIDNKSVTNIFDIVTDNNGDTYLSGAFNGEIKLGEFNLKPFGKADQFVAKINSAGKFIWAYNYGGKEDDGGNEIELSGNLIAVAAMSGGSYSFVNDKNQAVTYNSNERDGYILMIDKVNGKVLNSFQIGGTGEQQIRAIAINDKNEIAVGLEFDGTANFKSNRFKAAAAHPLSKNDFRPEKDGLIIVINPNGSLKWAKHLSSSRFDNIRGVAFDESYSVYAFGTHSNNASIFYQQNGTSGLDYSSLVSFGSYDPFLVKFSSDGTKDWYRRIESSLQIDNQAGGEIDVIDSNRIYVTHTFKDKAKIYDDKNIFLYNLYKTHTSKFDSLSLVHFNSRGSVRGAINLSGSLGPIGSAVIDARELDQSVAVGLGFESEAAGILTVSGNFITTKVTSDSREFGIIEFSSPSKKMVSGSKLEQVSNHGLTYYNLNGSKGVVLCFHGRGGSAQGWYENDKKELLKYLSTNGYQFICPSNISGTTWNESNSNNPDIKNVDSLLNTLNVPPSIPLFLIGHSNGGGFASRFTLMSSRKSQIKAVQYSNSTGAVAAIENIDYKFPTLIAYAECDEIYDEKKISTNVTNLNKNKVPNVLLNLDHVYRTNESSLCHELFPTIKDTVDFFDSF